MLIILSIPYIALFPFPIISQEYWFSTVENGELDVMAKVKASQLDIVEKGLTSLPHPIESLQIDQLCYHPNTLRRITDRSKAQRIKLFI